MIVQESPSSSDEQLLDQAIAEFLREESEGKAGDRQQWLDRFPACAEGLKEFFEDRDKLDRLVSPAQIDRPACSALTNRPASTNIPSSPARLTP